MKQTIPRKETIYQDAARQIEQEWADVGMTRDALAVEHLREELLDRMLVAGLPVESVVAELSVATEAELYALAARFK